MNNRLEDSFEILRLSGFLTDEDWITMKGTHVKIDRGESKGKAAKEFIKKKGGDPSPAKKNPQGSAVPESIQNEFNKKPREYSKEEIDEAVKEAKKELKKSKWFEGSEEEIVAKTANILQNKYNDQIDLRSIKEYKELDNKLDEMRKQGKDNTEEYKKLSDMYWDLDKKEGKANTKFANSVRSQIMKHSGLKGNTFSTKNFAG